MTIFKHKVKNKNLSKIFSNSDNLHRLSCTRQAISIQVSGIKDKKVTISYIIIYRSYLIQNNTIIVWIAQGSRYKAKLIHSDGHIP